MSGEEKIKCPVCRKKFDTESSMLQHKNDAHSAAKEKKPLTFKRALPYLIVVLIIAAVGGIAYWFVTSITGSINTFDFSFVPYEGNASAKINIIEFGDYQCPVCGAFFTQSQTKMINDYVKTGKARFYFMDFAILGPDSFTLAEGAWCANEQSLYYVYHDYIYSNQGQEGSGWATPGKVKSLTSNITGLNSQQFNSCLDSGKYLSQVKRLHEVGSESQVSGTPTFFIGNNNIGYIMIVGNAPYSDFQQKINSQIAKVS